MSLKLGAKGIGTVFLVLAIGIALGWFAHTIFALPPHDHQLVVDIFTIKTGPYVLDRTFLKSGEALWSLNILQDYFPSGKTYKYSLWVFSFQGDPEVYVCVWGPGTDGHTYQVEFCSAAGAFRSYTVTWNKNTKTFQDSLVIPVTLY